MSLNKSTARRLGLLAGSSFAAAGIAGAAFLVPAAAVAQVNACGDPGANLGAADSLTCASPPVYATGVDYSTTTNGDLTVILRNRFETGAAATGGIRMFGKAGEDMTLIREDNPAGAGDPRIVNTAGRAIDITTLGDGNVSIDLTDGDPTAGEDTSPGSTGIAPIRITGSTDAINAEAQGGGNVSVALVRTGQQSPPDHMAAVITSGTGAGIRARTTTGDINIDVGGAGFSVGSASSGVIDAASTGGGDVAINSDATGNSAISGRLYAIRAQTSGIGTLTVDHSGGIRADENNVNAVGLDLMAGVGKLTVNSVGSDAGIGGARLSGEFFAGRFAGTALRATYAGDAEFNLASVIADAHAAGPNWIADLSTTAGTTTINLGYRMGSGFTPNFGEAVEAVGNNSKTLRVQGGADVVFNVNGELRGFLDLSGGGEIDMAIRSGGQWRIGGATVFGAAADSLAIDAGGGMFATGIGASRATLSFGGGADQFANAGLLMVGGGGGAGTGAINDFPGELRFLGLETFENSGTISMGGRVANPEFGTDQSSDDLLYISGATFTGSGDSLILIDANLNARQSSCDAALFDSTTFDLPAADCIRIENGATAGETRVRVRELAPGDRGGFGEIVLVDISGGTSAAGHFILDEGSDNYSPANGGIIDKGFFVFPLVYDASTQQHKLAAVPGQAAQQLPLLAQAAHGLWRLSAGTWLDRQADMRGDIEGGMGGGVWMRIATEFADRDAVQTVDVLGNPFVFDNTNTQSSYAVTGGFDVLSGSAGESAWVLGVTAGYAHSDTAFDASPNELRLDGWTGGGYASFISGGLFVDAAVTGNRLELEGDVPGLGLVPLGTMVATKLQSMGGQVEAGWRLPVMEGAFVEPLAGVSYVRTKYDDMTIAADDPLRPPLVVEFDDPTSLRASVGGRVGLDQDYGKVRAQYSLLGRVWNEFEDETRIVVHNIGDDAILLDEFTGTFSEVGLGASVYVLDGVVSGFLNLGGKFGDDYRATNASAGIRVAW